MVIVLFDRLIFPKKEEKKILIHRNSPEKYSGFFLHCFAKESSLFAGFIDIYVFMSANKQIIFLKSVINTFVENIVKSILPIFMFQKDLLLKQSFSI